MDEVTYEEGFSEAEYLQLQENLFASFDSQQFQEEAVKEQYLNSIEEDVTKGIFDKYLEQGSLMDMKEEDGIHQVNPKDYFEKVKEQYLEAKGIKEDNVTKGIDKLIDIVEYSEKKQDKELSQEQDKELSQKPQDNELSQEPQDNKLSQEENQSIAETSKILSEQEKIDYIDLLEKETSADLVINLHEDEEFKNYKEENPKAGISDYLNDLKDKTNNKAQKEGKM